MINPTFTYVRILSLSNLYVFVPTVLHTLLFVRITHSRLCGITHYSIAKICISARKNPYLPDQQAMTSTEALDTELATDISDRNYATSNGIRTLYQCSVGQL